MFGQGDGLIEEKALAVVGTAEAERLTGLLEYEQQLWQDGAWMRWAAARLPGRW